MPGMSGNKDYKSSIDSSSKRNKQYNVNPTSVSEEVIFLSEKNSDKLLMSF